LYAIKKLTDRDVQISSKKIMRVII